MIRQRYKSRDCLTKFRTIKNNKYFSTWRANDSLYLSTANSNYNDWILHTKDMRIKENKKFTKTVVVCPCYQDTLRVYDPVTGQLAYNWALTK